MAEELLRHKTNEKFDLCNAGTHPETVDVRAIDGLEKFGLDVKNLTSKSMIIIKG
jgi:protein-tyrosine-phosphatase